MMIPDAVLKAAGLLAELDEPLLYVGGSVAPMY